MAYTDIRVLIRLVGGAREIYDVGNVMCVLKFHNERVETYHDLGELSDINSLNI
jgi:hypothetical protein